jgi:hypothetical protein
MVLVRQAVRDRDEWMSSPEPPEVREREEGSQLCGVTAEVTLGLLSFDFDVQTHLTQCAAVSSAFQAGRS